jgi:ammonium transporter, Amt family
MIGSFSRALARLARAGGLLASTAILALLFAAPAFAADAPARVPGVTYVVKADAISAGDTAWVLTSAALVIMMTLPGLAFFYGGLVRKRNILGTMTQIFATACAVSVLWFAIGYSLAFSHGNAWIGGLSKLPVGKFVSVVQGVAVDSLAPSIPETAFALFECGFAIITCALIVGAFAERVKFGVAVIFCSLWALLVYAPVAHWVWHPEGWANAMGVRDFAGGIVVHVNAGAAALACALVVGARRGFGKEPMIPSNLAYMLIGAGLLWIGWFGFNGGSALAANSQAGMASVNTLVSAALAAMVFMGLEWLFGGKASLVGMSTGAVAGLVAITPAAGYVTLDAAFAFGAAGGLVSYIGLNWLKPRLNVDDSLDVFAIHGLVGIAGSVMTPLFSRPELSGAPSSLVAELTATVAVFFYSFVVSWIVMKLLDLVIGARVSANDEDDGLDLSQHGESIE